MEKLTLPGNRGYLIAGIGGIVALFAFLFLPYISFSILGISASVNPTSIGGLIWIEALLALAAIVVPALLVYRDNPFGLSTTPVEKQIRWGQYAMIGVGGLGVLGQIIVAVNASNINYNGYNLSSIIGVSYSIGFWLYLLAMIAVITGGIVAYSQKGSSLASYQTWTPPTQYPPYQQELPPTPDYISNQQQWQQGQQQPPQQYPYDSQQWQQAQQQPQQPPSQYQAYDPEQWQQTHLQQQQQPYPPHPQQPPPSSPSWPPQQPPQT